MPGTMKTVFNNGGVPIATSADEFYQRQRLANQAQSSDDARLQAQLADNAANRALQLQTMGTYADKARDAQAAQQAGYTQATGLETLRGSNALALGRQGNEGALAVANVGNVVPLRALDNEQSRWADTRKDGAARRALDDQYATVEGNMLGRVFADRAADATSGAPAQPMTQDQMLKQWAVFKNPSLYGASEQRAQERDDAMDSQRVAAGTAMMASQDPRARAVGAALLKGSKAMGGVDMSALGGFSPQEAAQAGGAFLQRPEVQAEISAITRAAKAAQGSPTAEQDTELIKGKIQRLVARAEQEGGDPNAVMAILNEQLNTELPEASVFSNPLSTIPRWLGYDMSSRGAVRSGLGIK